MFTVIRAITLAAAVMLAVPATGTSQVGDFMKVPQDVWTNINRFVFLVALDANVEPGTPEYQRRNALASWAQVYAAGQQWARETFPALQQLAAELAKDDIRGRLQLMLQAAEAIAQGRDDQRAPFEAVATAIEKRITGLLAISASTREQIGRLDAASRAVRTEYQQRPTPDPALLEIEIRAERASEALRAATNAWSGLQSDVKELRRVVGAAQKVDPDLYARIGIVRWADVVRDAKGFLTDMKTQQRYLTGEDYYDNCGVEEGRSYALSGNPITGGSAYLGALGRSGDLGGSFIHLFDNADALALWQFKKLGKGWWQIHNQAWGEHFALDGGKGGAALVPVNPPPTTTGQFWRALPVRENRCYWFNSFEGAGYALEAKETRPRSRPPLPSGRGWEIRPTDVKLMPTTKREQQQWLVIPQ